MRRRYFVLAFVISILAAGLASFTLWSCLAEETFREEADRLSVLLGWKPGSVVADIGAGDGEMTRLASERVGATGRVYTTEIDDKKLAGLEDLAAEKKNITALKAGSESAHLPPACCDSILVRRVYHHFPKPERMAASLLEALKPGGRLAVIDFAPRAGLPAVEEDVPKNRGGHGVAPQIIIDELTAAGFALDSRPDDWPNGDYCLIFRKPAK
jgi:predicted methyltransferase